MNVRNTLCGLLACAALVAAAAPSEKQSWRGLQEKECGIQFDVPSAWVEIQPGTCWESPGEDAALKALLTLIRQTRRGDYQDLKRAVATQQALIKKTPGVTRYREFATTFGGMPAYVFEFSFGPVGDVTRMHNIFIERPKTIAWISVECPESRWKDQDTWMEQLYRSLKPLP